jgi:hypothetical protein
MAIIHAFYLPYHLRLTTQVINQKQVITTNEYRSELNKSGLKQHERNGICPFALLQ